MSAARTPGGGDVARLWIDVATARRACEAREHTDAGYAVVSCALASACLAPDTADRAEWLRLAYGLLPTDAPRDLRATIVRLADTAERLVTEASKARRAFADGYAIRD